MYSSMLASTSFRFSMLGPRLPSSLSSLRRMTTIGSLTSSCSRRCEGTKRIAFSSSRRATSSSTSASKVSISERSVISWMTFSASWY